MLLLLLSGFVSGRDQVGTLITKTIISAVHTGIATTCSHKYNDPITAANEAYGMHSLTVSTDQKLSAPVYEQVQ